VVGKRQKSSGPSRVFETLRRSILEGEYGPNERLVEEQLAERLKVSRTPIRQALTMLEAEGLVEIEPNKGAAVRSFSVQDVWEIYDLRAVLEGHAARRAASRISREELDRLWDLVREMEEQDRGQFLSHEEEIRWLVGANGEFHATIAAAGRNPRLEQLIQRTVQVPLVFKAFYWYTPHEHVISNHYHRQIAGALEAGDAERAEIVMREHVYEGRDFVIRALEEDRDG
jgi:DNA-binding GntR family transcriptional regulator